MWYVIQTVGGQEQAVRRMIEHQHSGDRGGQVEQCFIPMRERTVKRGGEWKKSIDWCHKYKWRIAKVPFHAARRFFCRTGRICLHS